MSVAVLAGLPVARAAEVDGGNDDASAGQLIEGIAVDHLGAGIAGAKVTIEAINAAPGEPPLATATTGKTGDISVRLPKKVEGAVRAKLTKEGFATFTQELDLADESQPPWIDATLEGAARLTGTVRDRLLGEPVKAAQIMCESGGQEFTAATDNQGRYRFDTICYGPVALVVHAHGFGTERRMLRVQAAEARADIDIGPERRVELRLITDDEKPAPDVRIEALTQPGNELLTAASGPDGKATLGGIPESAEAVQVRLNGDRYVHMPTFDVRIALTPSGAAPTATRPARPPVIRQELIVHVAGRVKGSVTAAVGGEPIVGVRVIAGREFRSDSPMGWTSLDGTYELTGLPPGVNVISFQHTSFAPVIQEVHLDQEQVATADAKMVSGSTIGGQVVDPDGNPVEQAFLSADNWKGYSTLGLRAVTDKEGLFSLPNAPDGPIEFSVVKPGYGRPEKHTLMAGKTDHRIKLNVRQPDEQSEMPSTAKLEIGKPVPDFTLVALDGTTYKLSQLRGRYVFLDCWATWCGPCMRELPNVVALRKATKDRADFMMIGISLDTDRDALKASLQEHGIDWAQVCGPKSGAREAFETLNGVGIPFMCLIGPDGTLLAQDLRGDTLTEQVKKLLAKPAGATKPAP